MLLPVILAIAVLVTFAGSAAAIRRAVSLDPVFALRGEHERANFTNAQDLRPAEPQAHTSMFLRMLVRAAVLRRGRAASALFAMVVAAAVATAMLNLYVDVQAKLQHEFRNYGANIVIVAKDGASLPHDALSRVDSVLAGRGIAAPFALVVARTRDGQAIVVAGTDFDRVRQLDRWWSVSSGRGAATGASRRARSAVGCANNGAVPRNRFDLSFKGKRLARYSSGNRSDRRSRGQPYLYFPARFCGVDGSAAFDDRSRGERLARRSRRQYAANCAGDSKCGCPSCAANHGRRGARAGQDASDVAGRRDSIILTAALCVLSTLMGWVFDRRRDFAIMKALGRRDVCSTVSSPQKPPFWERRAL